MENLDNSTYDGYIWFWYSALCIISCVNIVVYLAILLNPSEIKGPKDVHKYVWWM